MAMSADSEVRYLLFEHRGLPILCVPAAARSNVSSAFRSFIPFSYRRAIYRRGMLLGVQLCDPRTLGREVVAALPFAPLFPFPAFVETLSRVLDENDLYPVITFPSDLNRQRFYVTLLSGSGTPRAFVKATMGGSPSFASLIREAELSMEVSREANPLFRVPRVFHQGRFEGAGFVVMEALPLGVHRLRGGWNGRPRRISNHLSLLNQMTAPLEDLPWWGDFTTTRPQVPMLYRSVAAWSRQETDVGFAHGDFHRGNLYAGGGRVWIIDWEHASCSAPLLVDQIRFYLGDRTRELTRHPQKVVAGLLREFGAESAGQEHRPVGSALAYLCSQGNDAGILCGSNWPDLKAQE